MKGTGIREERETLINFNDADDLANIYTASETQYRRLKKRGWEPKRNSQEAVTLAAEILVRELSRHYLHKSQ